MGEKGVHTVEIIAPSIEALKEVFNVSGDVSEGMETALGKDATLTISDISKSTGFDVTSIIMIGIIPIVLDVSRDIIAEWLKSKLLKKKGVTIILDGKKIEVSEGGQA